MWLFGPGVEGLQSHIEHLAIALSLLSLTVKVLALQMEAPLLIISICKVPFLLVGWPLGEHIV